VGQSGTFSNTFFVLIFSEEVEKLSKKMEEVRDAGVRVVSEDFLKDIKSSGKALQELVSLHAISPWGAEVKVEPQAPSAAPQVWSAACQEHRESEGRGR